jgi:hypothetical protein
MLQDLLFSTKELSDNVERASDYIHRDLALKIKSDLNMQEEFFMFEQEKD